MTKHEEALHLGAVLVAGEVAQDIGLMSALDTIALHESGHAILWLALGADPSKMRITIDGRGGVVTYPTTSDDEASAADKIPSDDTKFEGLSAALVGCGFAPLDRAAINLKAEEMLRERWDLVTIIAARLTQRLAVSEKVCMDGNELAWLYFFHQLRRGD